MKKIIIILLSSFFFLSTSFSGCFGYYVEDYCVSIFLKNNSHDTLKICDSEGSIKYCQPSDSTLFFLLETVDKTSLDLFDYYMDRIFNWIEQRNVQMFIGQNEIPREQIMMRDNYMIFDRQNNQKFRDLAILFLVTDSMLQEPKQIHLSDTADNP